MAQVRGQGLRELTDALTGGVIWSAYRVILPFAAFKPLFGGPFCILYYFARFKLIQKMQNYLES